MNDSSFRIVVYYNDDEYEPRKSTRNDDVSTQNFRSRTRCRWCSEIITSLLADNSRRDPIFVASCRIVDPRISHDFSCFVERCAEGIMVCRRPGLPFHQLCDNSLCCL